MVSDFVVIGSINHDVICMLERIPRAHEKVRDAEITTCLGGSAANTAGWLASFGFSVRLVGTVGRDDEGAACRAMIDAAGIESVAVAVDPQARTGRAVCLSTRRAKRIITSAGPGLRPALRRLHEDGRDYGRSMVHVAAQETPDLAAACRAAHASGATVSIELNGRTMESLRDIATVALLNHVELREVFGVSWQDVGVSVLTEILPQPDAHLVVTLGRRGAMCIARTGITHVPARRVEIVERTGAGDAFNAGFLAGQARDLSVGESLRQGISCAADALGKVGGQPQ